jgi:voltage-gated potassium channel
LIERRASRFLHGPASIRNAVGAIVSATALVVVGAAALIRVFDHEEYKSFGEGVWWAIQTVTTVGYGDVTPARTSGRIIAAVVMLWGIAFLAVLAAAVTSIFVARATLEREEAAASHEEGDLTSLDARFDDLSTRLDRVERALSRIAGS